MGSTSVTNNNNNMGWGEGFRIKKKKITALITELHKPIKIVILIGRSLKKILYSTITALIISVKTLKFETITHHYQYLFNKGK